MIDGPNPRPRHVHELDGLRGLLSLWVAISHVFCWCGFSELELPRPSRGIWTTFVYAEPAVETFIILSGFAISFLLDGRRPSYRDFLVGRFFRIYPVYLACLVLGISTFALAPMVIAACSWRDTIYFRASAERIDQERLRPVAHVIAHLSLLNGMIPKRWLPMSTATLLPPGWSITLEWQYYLVAPLIARLARSATGLLLVGGVAWLGLQYGAGWANPHAAFLPVQLPLFLVGIGTYHAYAWYANDQEGRPVDFTRPAVAMAMLAILAAWHPVSMVIWAVGIGSASALGGDPLARASRVAGEILCLPPLQWLGKVSYTLYLVHWPLIIVFLRLLLWAWPAVPPQVALMVLFSLGLPMFLVAASLLQVHVEAPMMAIGKRWTRGVPGPPRPVVP